MTWDRPLTRLESTSLAGRGIRMEMGVDNPLSVAIRGVVSASDDVFTFHQRGYHMRPGEHIPRMFGVFSRVALDTQALRYLSSRT